MPLNIDLRPTTFDEVIGNVATIKSLQKKLKEETRPHCIMFTGESGTGKTTLVKLCSEELGANPINIHTLNIGEARGIDSVRDSILPLLENYPLGGGVTVIQLEEVQSSTKAFQEALLVPLENLPEHVYVFMSTTNPSKLLTTLRRRFVEYKLQKVDSSDMLMYLVRIMKDTDTGVDPDVLETLMEQADGSLGKALVLLEKMTGLDTEEQYVILHGDEIANKTIIDLCQALLYGKTWNNIIPILKDLEGDAESYRHIIQNYMMKVLLNVKGRNQMKAGQIIVNFSEPIKTKAEFVAICYIIVDL